MDLGKQGKNSSFKASNVQEEHLENVESLIYQCLAFIQGNLLEKKWHLFFWAESIRAVPYCQKKGKRPEFWTDNFLPQHATGHRSYKKKFTEKKDNQ